MNGDGVATARAQAALPRLGFLGAGWIGRHRLAAVADSGTATIIGVADAAEAAVHEALALAPDALPVTSLDELLEQRLDGVVIATPSALHAEQAVRALEQGLAVFCQKPLARTAAEARRVVAAAKAADRLLAVDMSYRHIAGMRRIRARIRAGSLGRIRAIDVVFHNAYGPDKPWFRDARLAGGGCLIDLGTHLVDLALWALDFPTVAAAHGRLYAHGAALAELRSDARVVEDFATAELVLGDGAIVRLACSWHLHAGRDAVIEAAFFGTEGGAALRNVAGSFYDFVAEEYHGTASSTLASPPDEWGGRAIVDWAVRLARGERYDASCETYVQLAAVLDRIYGRS